MLNRQQPGSWHRAAGAYIPDSECIPSWKVWAAALIVLCVFFGVVPLVGFMAGF